MRATEELGYTWDDIRSKSRVHSLVDIKTCICKYLYRNNWTLQQIANELNMHHASVIHHKKKFDDLLPIDREIQIIWRTINQTL